MPILLNVDPRLLVSNPFNCNVVSPTNEAKIDAALTRMGFFKPIVVREYQGKLQILGGQHRCESAIRIGLNEVPIFNLGEIDDKRAKEISLADNARYGTDDVLQLAAIIADIGLDEDIQNFLPFTETDISSLFSASSIDLDELNLDDDPVAPDTPEQVISPKEAKTHTIMRFKVPLGDAEKITELITKTQKRHGYTGSDELTNAGDALVHVLFELTPA